MRTGWWAVSGALALTTVAQAQTLPIGPAHARAAAPESASPEEGLPAPERAGLWAGIDRLLVQLDRQRAQAGQRRIALEFQPGTAVTIVDEGLLSAKGAQQAEIVEHGQRKTTVRLADGSTRTVPNNTVYTLNHTFKIADGSSVLAGSSLFAGALMHVDRRSDKVLREFLAEAERVAEQARPQGEREVARRLTELVNERLKYPGHETPDRRSSEIEKRHTGGRVPLGVWLEAGEGACRHKALALKLALEALGWPSRYVSGDALDPRGRRAGGHSWVEVITPSGQRIVIDPTWKEPWIPLAEAYRRRHVQAANAEYQRVPLPTYEVLPPQERPEWLKRLRRLLPGTRRDTFAEWRRADRTVAWQEVPRRFLLEQANGVAHFAFALFLKELPGALLAGEPGRLEELIGVLTTLDFFKSYAVFAVGAQGGTLVFDRLALGRQQVPPTFTQSLLRTQVALTAGMALAQVVEEGELQGRELVIDAGAFGLSTALVKGAAEGLRRSGLLALRPLMLLGASGSARWVYTAGELALILTVGEAVGGQARAALDERAARARIEAAERALRALPPSARPERVTAALGELAAAHDGWRELLLTPVGGAGLEPVRAQARRVQAGEQAESEVLEAIGAAPRLARYLEERAGSQRDYLSEQSGGQRAALGQALAQAGEVQLERLRAVFPRRLQAYGEELTFLAGLVERRPDLAAALRARQAAVRRQQELELGAIAPLIEGGSGAGGGAAVSPPGWPAPPGP